MKCYNCGYPIDSDFKESCHVCGAVFSKICNYCHNYNPKYADYCFSCGKHLEDVNIEVTISEQRRNVGVLFADISGFTSLAEKLDPEETREVINECFQRITRPVYELGGIVDKYIGDCVMVLFGAVHAHLDDSLRVVECALKMKKSMDEFSNENASKLGLKLNLTIGVSYGLVVTGKVGNLYDTDQTVIGDVVNTASRLQNGALPGEILVTKRVYNETNTVINYNGHNSINAKNKEKCIVCYEPIGSTYYKSENIINYIDRNHEISLLNNFFGMENRTSILEVVGAQGTGKTVLLQKYIKSCEFDYKELFIDILRNQKERPYSGLSLLIHGIINIDEGVSNRVRRNRLISYTDYILSDKTDDEIIRNYNFISILLGLEKDNDYESIINSMVYPDLIKELICQTNIFFTNATNKHQLLVVFDNAHYLDKKSIEILSNINGIKGYIIFISHYSIFMNSDYFQLNLSNFTKDEALLFVQNNSIHSLREVHEKRICLLSNQNPLYLNELIRMMNNSNYEVDCDGFTILTERHFKKLPKTLTKVLNSKLDELDSLVIEYLEIASLVGDEFDLSVPFRIMDYQKDFEELIELMLSRNILEVASYTKINNKLARKYKFSQKEMRVVLENRILKSNKKIIHEQIAIILQIDYKDILDRHYDEIGFQYEMAGKLKLAKDFYYDNATILQADYLYEDAIHYYNKYLDIENRSNNIKTEPRVLKAVIAIATIYINISDFNNAILTIRKGLDFQTNLDDEHQLRLLLVESYKSVTNIKDALEELSNLKRKLQTTSRHYGKMLQLQCTLYNMTGKPGVIQLADQSKEILLKAKDFESIAEIMTQSGIRFFIEGKLSNGITYLEQALEYAEKSKNKAIIAKVMSNLAILYDNFGERNKSHVYFKQSIEISKLISNSRNYVSTAINLGVSYLHESMFVDAQELLEEAVKMARESNLLYQECVSLSNLADVKYELGNFREAELLYIQSKVISETIEMPIETAISDLGIVKSTIMEKQYDSVESILEKVLKIFIESNEISYIVSTYNVLTKYFIIQHKLDLALNYAQQSVKYALETNDVYDIVKSKRKLAEVLLEESKVYEANKLLDEITKDAITSKLYSELTRIYYIRYLFLEENDLPKARKYLFKAYNTSILFDNCYISKLLYKDVIKEKLI